MGKALIGYLLAQGQNQSQIAKTLGITRQRVNQVANPFQQRSRGIYQSALKAGKNTKPEICVYCRQTKPLHGHHQDYSRPLEVIWLCSSCHGFEHKTQNIYRKRTTIYKSFPNKRVNNAAWQITYYSYPVKWLPPV